MLRHGELHTSYRTRMDTPLHLLPLAIAILIVGRRYLFEPSDGSQVKPRDV